MKAIKLDCQSCGAGLDIKDNMGFCPYCGEKVMLDDENRTTTHNYNYTHVKKDEARIRENERKEKVRLKELENEESQQKREHKELIFILILLVTLLVGLFFFVPWSETSNEDIVEMPCSASKYKGESYEMVVQQLEDLGFDNVTTATKKDLGAGWITKNGSVYAVSINGVTNFRKGDDFPKDAEVVVTYHTFKK